jgi:RNA-directed DNA polymerase
LRAIHIKHWKRGKTTHRELLALGASAKVALLLAKDAQVGGEANTRPRSTQSV